MKPQYYIYIMLLVPLVVGIGAVSWGYYPGSGIVSHLTFHGAHASVWHLAGNALCFFVITQKSFRWSELCAAYIIATLCSFISPHRLPTIGMSGLIFALYGIRLSRFSKLSARFIIQTLLVLLLPGLMGKVNVLLHISCLCLGYISAYVSHHISQLLKDARYYR